MRMVLITLKRILFLKEDGAQKMRDIKLETNVFAKIERKMSDLKLRRHKNKRKINSSGEVEVFV